MTTPTPGWLPDPTGRHEHRYWDGNQWCDEVADGGMTGVDPVAGPEPQTGGYGESSAAYGSGPYDTPPPRSGPSTGLLLGLGALLAVLVIGLVLVIVNQDDGGGGGAETASDTEDVNDDTEDTADTTTTSIDLGDLGDVDAGSDAVVSAMASSLVTASNGVLTQGEADCLAGGMIEQVGLDRLVEAGQEVLANGATNVFDVYTDDERQAIAGVINGCVPAEKLGDLTAVFGEFVDDAAGG